MRELVVSNQGVSVKLKKAQDKYDHMKTYIRRVLTEQHSKKKVDLEQMMHAHGHALLIKNLLRDLHLMDADADDGDDQDDGVNQFQNDQVHDQET